MEGRGLSLLQGSGFGRGLEGVAESGGSYSLCGGPWERQWASPE